MNNKGHPWDFFRLLLSHVWCWIFSLPQASSTSSQASLPVPSYKEFDQSNAPAAASEIHPHVCTKATLPQAAPSQWLSACRILEKHRMLRCLTWAGGLPEALANPFLACTTVWNASTQSFSPVFWNWGETFIVVWRLTQPSLAFSLRRS